VITDAAGIPLAVILTGGHRNDVTQLLPLLDAIPADPRPARPAATTPRQGLRRPRLRPRHPLRTPRRHPPDHDQPGLFDHLPSEPAPLALICQGKNPARVSTNHPGSSSQG